MRFYDNPMILIANLFRIGSKSIKRKAEERDKQKTILAESKRYLMSEEDRQKRYKILDRRKKWAMRSLFVSIVGIFVGSAMSPMIAIIFSCMALISTAYGLWYSLWGKY